MPPTTLNTKPGGKVSPLPEDKDTRTRLLDLGQHLFQTRGYNAFSYRDLGAKIGIRNASIHHHFPTKEALGLAIVARYQEWFLNWSRIKAGLTPPEQVEAFFRMYGRFVRDEEKLCPVGMLETDFHTLPKALQQATQQLVRTIREWLTEVLAQGRNAGRFHYSTTSEGAARMMAAALVGALALSRSEGTELLDGTCEELRRFLGMSPPVGAEQRGDAPSAS